MRIMNRFLLFTVLTISPFASADMSAEIPCQYWKSELVRVDKDLKDAIKKRATCESSTLNCHDLEMYIQSLETKKEATLDFMAQFCH